MKIVVGVTGGIAAFKVPSLVSSLVREGFDVSVIMTEGATRIISPVVFSSLTGNKAYTDIWEDGAPQPLHIRLANGADALVVVPATANTIAKMATGIADNLLTATALAFPQDKHRILAPSMEENMLTHPATQSNIDKLKSWGWVIIEPEKGRLATGKTGKGRLPEPTTIFKRIISLLHGASP